MVTQLSISGEAKFGQHKILHCRVQLRIQEDIGCVKATGELSYECFPTDDHPLSLNAVGELTLVDSKDSSLSTKCNILIVEKSNSVDIIPKKIRRYFWQFYIVGKPVWDKLQVFENKIMNRVFTCTNFRGHYSAPVASVIVAPTIQDARQILIEKMKECKIPLEDYYELKEIDLYTQSVDVLIDGSLF